LTTKRKNDTIVEKLKIIGRAMNGESKASLFCKHEIQKEQYMAG
jgi:hypothetical protein